MLSWTTFEDWQASFQLLLLAACVCVEYCSRTKALEMIQLDRVCVLYASIDGFGLVAHRRGIHDEYDVKLDHSVGPQAHRFQCIGCGCLRFQRLPPTGARGTVGNILSCGSVSVSGVSLALLALNASIALVKANED